MKKVFLLSLFVLSLFTSFTYPAERLMDPAALAAVINDPNAVKPLIINVGMVAMIKGAKYIGQAEDPANKEKLRSFVKDFPKNKDMVIYCGCCKLVDCWNIQEADKLLQSMGFTKYKILNLPTDLHTDWISKKYPMN